MANVSQLSDYVSQWSDRRKCYNRQIRIIEQKLTFDYTQQLSTVPYNPVSSRSRIIPGRQVLLPEENISFNSRPV